MQTSQIMSLMSDPTVKALFLTFKRKILSGTAAAERDSDCAVHIRHYSNVNRSGASQLVRAKKYVNGSNENRD